MFKKGDLVRYIPTHAKDSSHKDCENGVVSSVTDNYIFVKYDNNVCKMVTGDELYTAQATFPDELKLRYELKVMGKVYE